MNRIPEKFLTAALFAFVALGGIAAGCAGDGNKVASAGSTGGSGSTSTSSNGSTANGTSTAGTGSTPSNTVPKDLPSGFFLIGVWGQSVVNPPGPAVWKSRGINTFVASGDSEEYVTTQEFDAALAAQDLKVIRHPAPDPAQDLGSTTLIAWMQPDEPDVEGVNLEGCAPFTGQYPCTDMCESNYKAWRALDPTRPIFVNFSGSDILQSEACNFCNGAGDDLDYSGCTYLDSAKCYPRLIAAADWISEDMYPVSGWIMPELRNDLSSVGKSLDKLARWTDKPRFAIIETSFLGLTGTDVGTRGVTPGEFRAEVWNAIIHGASGIIYFPFNVGESSWSYDATPTNVAQEMTTQDALITQLAGTLRGTINPSGIAASVSAPLEAGWRRIEGRSVFFVLNLSNTQVASASVALTGVGSAPTAEVFGESRSLPLAQGRLTDSFGPYAVHIYVVAEPS